MHPNKDEYDRILASEFAPTDQARIQAIQQQENDRISKMTDEKDIETEIDEATNKWTKAYKVLQGQEKYPYVSDAEQQEKAKWELVYAYHRYWSALPKRKQVRAASGRESKWQYWVALVVGIIAAIAGVWALFK